MCGIVDGPRSERWIDRMANTRNRIKPRSARRFCCVRVTPNPIKDSDKYVEKRELRPEDGCLCLSTPRRLRQNVMAKSSSGFPNCALVVEPSNDHFRPYEHQKAAWNALDKHFLERGKRVLASS